MRYWLDTEFIEDGKTIDLMSISIVAEDGRELYLQSCEFRLETASPWVKENVFPCLNLCPHVHHRGRPSLPRSLIAVDLVVHEQEGQCTFEDPSKGIIGGYTDCPWRTREQIRNEVRVFLDPAQHGKIELWGYYSAYDHVVFCQLFGAMVDLPKGYPMYTRDIQQVIDERNISTQNLPPQPADQHNALTDARWVKQAWEHIYC